MTRFQFVADHQRRHGVKRLCAILGIARSSFYYWRRTAPKRAARQAADAQLAARIRQVHRDSDGTYGVPRITAELRDDGRAVNHKRVARVMRTIGLTGVRLRRRHRMTVPAPSAAKAPDLIGRDFTAAAPNTKYVGDITYLSTDQDRIRHLTVALPPHYAARLFDAQEAGATEQQLNEIAAEALKEVYFQDNGRRAGRLEEVRFTDIEHLEFDL
ncbi:IS3 family transposase [Streptomyces sp. NBC_00201]|uniref:telomere-protecting terminal protein Tpg n=1 Tax=unclassified Streptomyces TaxID=2593676 RepID=UPI00225A1A24|nr:MULTISPECIES: IS3 family transposase [unclassified Streptomyces]MCX5064216.1 IS3 family transposase [Streptomyces sp. NBC_00452]MCX5251998.1 IS3 family transposase [Streptomyces sp. NBC_00201]